MNNKKNALVRFFWLPILLFQVTWLLLKIVFLSLTHVEACNSCEKQLYRNPRKVNYRTRQGVQLCCMTYKVLGAVLIIACAIASRFL